MSLYQAGNSFPLRVWGYDSALPSVDNSRFQAAYVENEQPPAEEHNLLWRENAEKTNHILYEGVPLWNADREYTANQCAKFNNRIYLCLATNTNSQPSGSNTNWLAVAMISEVKEAAQPGMEAAYYRSSAPAGWLKANGAAVLISSYSDLFNAIYQGAAANNTAEWGYRCSNPANPTGSRTTSGNYIALPDRRGVFGRGWDDGKGIDSGRLLYSYQADSVIAHSHSGTTGNESNTHSHTIPSNVDNLGPLGSRDLGSGANVRIANSQSSNASTSHTHTFTTSSQSPTGESETRPKNLARLICIKY
jgi:phage-related tail fiber protein